jgi:branched-chain amino acid transport system permease protein
MWRMVLMPLMLVLLMIFRPRGIMGLREFRWLIPGFDLYALKYWRAKKEVSDGTPAS